MDRLKRRHLGGLKEPGQQQTDGDVPLRRTVVRGVCVVVFALVALAYVFEPSYHVEFREPSTERVVLASWYSLRQDRAVFLDYCLFSQDIAPKLRSRLVDRGLRGGASMAGPWRNLRGVQWIFGLSLLVGGLFGACAYAARSRLLAVFALLLPAGGALAFGWSVHEVAILEQRWLLGSGDPTVKIGVPTWALAAVLSLAPVATIRWRPRRDRASTEACA